MEMLAVLFVSSIVSLIPALSYLLFIWWLDRYDREPWYLVAAAFLWGAVGAVFLSVVVSLAFTLPLNFVLGSGPAAKLNTVLVAPFVEETAKGCLILLLVFSRKFDGFIDGMVYGAAIGLGFAFSENIVYFSSVLISNGFTAWAVTVIVRTACTTLMHALATGATGAGIGYINFTRKTYLRFVIPPLGWLCAVCMHAFFNGALVVTQAMAQPVIFLVDIMVLALEISLAFVVMQVALHNESKVLTEELSEEVENGVLSPEHLGLVPSYLARLRMSLPRLFSPSKGDYGKTERFFDLATTLALKKHEAALCTGSRRKALLDEAEKARRGIAVLRADKNANIG